jgi:hypothetical protein
MHTLKLTQIGNSVGAIFPKELLARLQLEKGDELYVTEPPTACASPRTTLNLKRRCAWRARS